MITEVEKIYFNNNFISYKMIKNNTTFQVPLDPANTDYQAIQEWIAEGGVVIDNGENN
jgi:hypothetical protein